MRKLIVAVLSVLISIWGILYISGVVLVSPGGYRGIILGGVLAVIFITKPFKSKIKSLRIIVDILLILMTVTCYSYYVINYNNLSLRAGLVYWYDIMFTIFAVLTILEAIRRTVGWILSAVILFFIIQAAYGSYLPLIPGSRDYSISRLSNVIFLGNTGIFGLPLDVAVTVIFVFVLFGAFFTLSGVGKAFIDLAFGLFGSVRGGPAKVSIFASGFMGSVSGSAAANVVTTGVFTIPMMKRVGYTSRFAGAVEAVASTGGMILPPIMAAAGFIIAQFLGISYSEVMLMALIPALFYYLTLYISIDAEAGRKDIKGLSRIELPSVVQVLKQNWYLFIPLVLLLLLLLYVGWSPNMSGLVSLAAVIVVSLFRNETRIDFKRAVEACQNAVEGISTVVVACAGAGIIVAIFSLTGLGTRLSRILVDASGENLFILLVMVAVAGIILGMGLTATAIYLTLVLLLAPAVAELGMPVEVAHMFVFYYGILSSITPPVAIAAYAASGLTGDSPMKVALTASKLALPLYILPFTFALNPAYLMIGSWDEIAMAVFSGLFAVFALATSIIGYYLTNLQIVFRSLLFLSGILLIIPEIISDLVGFALFALITGRQYFLSKKMI